MTYLIIFDIYFYEESMIFPTKYNHYNHRDQNKVIDFVKIEDDIGLQYLINVIGKEYMEDMGGRFKLDHVTIKSLTVL